jgi:predicted DsbA family dithiol-disulfide isomerase
MKITVYTDPGCPFGFNAQRQDLQLAWHYGHAIDVTRRMIVLTEASGTYEERGLDPAMVEANSKRLVEQYGMPMMTAPGDRLPATIMACRAYVGARLNEPARADALLRALRRRRFSEGQDLDSMDTIHGAAADADIALQAVDAWLVAADVEAALRADMADTRSPLPEALALPHKLSKSDGKWRYSTASAVFEHAGQRVVAPGFQPFAVHEVTVASLAPEIERRPVAAGVDEVLAWAPYALATAEIAELRGVPIDRARGELEASGASFTPAAGDGYWSA